MAANFKAAVNIAHTAWIASGAPGVFLTNYTVTLDNVGVSVTSFGYPDNGGGYSPNATVCAGLLAAIMSNAPQTVSASGSTQVTSSVSCTDTPCYIA